MTLDTKNNTQPPFQFTRTSIGFMKRDSDFSMKAEKKEKSTFKLRNLSLGHERDFINENIGKIKEYDFMTALKHGKKINGILH